MISDPLRRHCATPGRAHVAEAVQIVTRTGTDHREAASMLATCQSVDDLTLVKTGELRACLVHELVLRGAVITEGLPGDHPLAWLPLTRSELEEHPDLPNYNVRGGSSYTTPYGPEPAHGPTTATGRGSSAVEAPTDIERAVAAVAPWTADSNGQVEARTFVLTEPLESLPDTLLGLGLTCLNGAESSFWTASIAPDWAWRVLFGAASHGGAYGEGLYGAYGRLAAWRSLGALAGAPEDANAEEVEARVRECAWHRFDTGTAWFENVAWDIGLVAVSPDDRMAVLAATDTD